MYIHIYTQSVHLLIAMPPSPHPGQSNQEKQSAAGSSGASTAVSSHLLYVTIGLLSFFVCCFGFILLYMNIRFAKPKEGKLPPDDQFECASSSNTTTTTLNTPNAATANTSSSSLHSLSALKQKHLTLSNAARMAELIEMGKYEKFKDGQHGLTIPATMPLYADRGSTHSSPCYSTLNSSAVLSPHSQCTEAPSIYDKDAKSPPLPTDAPIGSIPMTATVRTKSSTSIRSVEPTYSAVQIVDDDESVDAECTPKSAASDMNPHDVVPPQQHHQHHQHQQQAPPPQPLPARMGKAEAASAGNGAYFVFPSDRSSEAPVVSPWQRHVNDKTPVQYLSASPNGNRGTLRPMMIPSESRTVDSLATISVSIPTGHSSLSSTQRQLQPIMYQAPGQQQMAMMQQIMSVSQPPSLSSFLASNRSNPSNHGNHGHHHQLGHGQPLQQQPLQLQQHHLPNHHSNQSHNHLSPRTGPRSSVQGVGSPLSTQFDSNELKAHQHIRLPPSHSSLTTLKPPESILSGLTSITSQSRSRTRTLDRHGHAGSHFTALSQSDHSDDADGDDHGGGGVAAAEEEVKLVADRSAAASDSKLSKKDNKRFHFGHFNGYAPQHSNNPMSVFNAYNHQMMESPRLGAGSPCVSPSRTNDSWTKSHFSGNGITLVEPRK